MFEAVTRAVKLLVFLATFRLHRNAHRYYKHKQYDIPIMDR